MELQDTTTSILLAMAYSVKIEPGGHRTVPLECNSQLEDQIDIRVDAGFHHRNPNVYIPPSHINNPGNEFHPQCKVQPRYASLGYPFHNIAAHM